MNWMNEEQYPDYTAEEAIFRIMCPVSERAALLDDKGCLLLIEAVIRQAVEDYGSAKWMNEVESFFRSEYFHLMTGVKGDRFILLMRKEMRER